MEKEPGAERPSSSSESIMQCPKCAHDMEKMTYKDIEVDRCTLCKGLWFDALEHEALRDTPGSEAIDSGDP